MSPAEPQFAEPGEWIEPVTEGFMMGCCHCGLVHNFDFRITAHDPLNTLEKARIQYRCFTNRPATHRARKEAGGPVWRLLKAAATIIEKLALEPCTLNNHCLHCQAQRWLKEKA